MKVHLFIVSITQLSFFFLFLFFSRKDSSTSENSRQSERFWTEEVDAELRQTLSQLQNKGKFNVEDPFKLSYLEAIKRSLVAKFPEFDRTTEDIQSRIKTLKSDFHIAHEILTGPNSSGFLLDSEKMIVTVENYVWDAYSQVYIYTYI